MKIIAEKIIPIEIVLEKAVYTTSKHTGVFTDTLLVAEAFGRKHKNILAIITRHLKSGSISRLNIQPSEYTNHRGRKYKMYQLDRKAFIVLALSFTGADADRLKGKFVDLFLDQEKELDHWRGSRERLKSNHLEFTDEIKPLADLLIMEGSRHGNQIYSTIQRQINKAVTGKPTPRGSDQGTYREQLSQDDLDDIKRIEDVVFVIVDHWIGIDLTGRQTRDAVKRFLHGDLPGMFTSGSRV